MIGGGGGDGGDGDGDGDCVEMRMLPNMTMTIEEAKSLT